MIDVKTAVTSLNWAITLGEGLWSGHITLIRLNKIFLHAGARGPSQRVIHTVKKTLESVTARYTLIKKRVVTIKRSAAERVTSSEERLSITQVISTTVLQVFECCESVVCSMERSEIGLLLPAWR